MTITAPDGRVMAAETPEVAEDRGCLTIPIANPQLWWPNGYGAQPLYEVKVEVIAAGTQSQATEPQP